MKRKSLFALCLVAILLAGCGGGAANGGSAPSGSGGATGDSNYQGWDMEAAESMPTAPESDSGGRIPEHQGQADPPGGAGDPDGAV